jgi:hypothetical protein
LFDLSIGLWLCSFLSSDDLQPPSIEEEFKKLVKGTRIFILRMLP